MKLDDKLKKEIDDMDYESMLRKWRFTLSRDPMFQGESGEYYKKVMFEKRDKDPIAAVQASKNIGWEK